MISQVSTRLRRTLVDSAAALGPKLCLAHIGLRASDLDHAADLAAENPYPNPTPITRALLDDPFHRRRPAR